MHRGEGYFGALDNLEVVEKAVLGCQAVFHLAGRPQQGTADPRIYRQVYA